MHLLRPLLLLLLVPGTPNRRPTSIRIESELQRNQCLAEEEEQKEKEKARLKAETEEKARKGKEAVERKRWKRRDKKLKLRRSGFEKLRNKND